MPLSNKLARDRVSLLAQEMLRVPTNSDETRELAHSLLNMLTDLSDAETKLSGAIDQLQQNLTCCGCNKEKTEDFLHEVLPREGASDVPDGT